MIKEKSKKISQITNKISRAKDETESMKTVKPELSEMSVQKLAVSEKQLFPATGKRKTAIAQVRLFVPGSGQILINNKNLKEYFPYFEWQQIVEQPLDITGQKGKCDIIVKLKGGGLRAQAEAVRLGISKALVQFNSELRKILKPQGLLTRDARIKERKKPGLKRARRAPQWQKR